MNKNYIERNGIEEIITSSENLASILMAKNTYVPWRGQPNLVIKIPYDEWLSFVMKYKDMVTARLPLNYTKIYNNRSNSKLLKRYYMFDVSWSLYNEIMVSANMGLDATTVLPLVSNDSDELGFKEILEEISLLGEDMIGKYYCRFKSSSPSVVEIPLYNLSSHNYELFLLSIYLQKFAYDDEQIINIRR